MVDIAFDRRITSHMSAGMIAYVRNLETLLPHVAPDLSFAFTGHGDNFDRAEQLDLPFALARLRPRLAHIPSPFTPLFVPVPYVITIHDLIDLHFPQFGKSKVQPYYRTVVAFAARRARAVITDDPATGEDLVRFLGVRAKRIRVVPLGADLPKPLPPPMPHPRPYLLYVGNRRPHKNVATLVAAWASLPAELDVDLVLSGADDGDPALAPLRRAQGGPVYLGERSDAELVRWYRGAVAYVHPALREGFGLPLLEAMRAGAPVIAAHSALPRVLAPHAFGFEALDVEELRDLLRYALTEPAVFARSAAAAQAATHALTWENTARLTADVYRECW
jgi:glycosyltransferase involved in cell wall biosynthesis